MEYSFREIEKKWQKYWAENESFRAEPDANKPKYYVLDMFPYPSGAGLHVGHPLGYIASDIFSRYKRLKGFNVLHPAGYDAFGLPAEQYAIETGQHPAITTETNIARYRQQLDNIGFSFDWSKEVRTCEPSYYKWTQWIFKQLFGAWYDYKTQKAASIDSLCIHFSNHGNDDVSAATDSDISFTAAEWNAMNDYDKEAVLQHYRLAFRSETMVNWCPKLGTVLANDEIKDGVSERGGHAVVQKKMQQWSLRITAYAQRLLDDLNELDWTDAIKEQQRNWIGRSKGASVSFDVIGSDKKVEVFTTRPDTIFGVSFMVLAPEHELVAEITTEDYREDVDAYVEETSKRSERDRMSDVKKITGAFTGAYVKHPFSGEEIPIWIGDYVLASYGTGAVMSVPAHDSRDYAFANHFRIPIRAVVAGGNINEEAFESKDGTIINSDFLDGLDVKAATKVIIEKIEAKGLGKGKTNFRLRDAIFSRQRYWGEPFPVYYKDGIPQMLEDDQLPLILPEVDKYLPTEEGEPPLARAENWNTKDGYELETNTMPGWAGSSWYFLRYMDAKNETALVSKEKADYWKSVDLYIGGSEHATGHLLYARFWMKFLYDMGFVAEKEPFKKLINQGMILGRSSYVYRINGSNKFVSHGLKEDYETTALHVDVNIVQNDVLDIAAFREWREEYADAEFELEDGKYICGFETEKMSKRWYNVVNPDDICHEYGADTLRLYEMFLGPLEQYKPWNTNGISGVHNFLRKFWRLFHGTENKFVVVDEEPTKEEYKILHKTIKKAEEDIENFSFNTSVSTFMVCVNELSTLKCNKREILEALVVLVSPYAPHIAEELWSKLGHEGGVSLASFPVLNEDYLKESSFTYPVSFNGKMRFTLDLPADMSKEEIEKTVLGHEKSANYLDGKTPKKVIVVPKRIVNIVV